MNKTSRIQVTVSLDEKRIPGSIEWSASDREAGKPSQAKAMMLAFWDKEDKTALRIDLWTKDMMVDEMTDFFYQTLMTMADTYQRATQHSEKAAEIKKFAAAFLKKEK